MNDKRIVSIFFISYLNSMRRKFQFQMLSITASLASSKSNTGNVKPKRSSMWTSALSVINRADLQQLQKDWSLVCFFFLRRMILGFKEKYLKIFLPLYICTGDIFSIFFLCSINLHGIVYFWKKAIDIIKKIDTISKFC